MNGLLYKLKSKFKYIISLWAIEINLIRLLYFIFGYINY